MQKNAIVTDVHGNIAEVEVSRHSACSGCSQQESCHACIVLSDKNALKTKAYDPIGVHVGDRVLVETESSTVIGYAATVFLLPLLLATVGYVVASLLSHQTFYEYVGALAGFFLSLPIIYFGPGKRAEKRCDVKIVKVIEGTDV